MVIEEIDESWFTCDLPEELSKRAMEGIVEVIATAAKPFFEQGCDHVVAARHCGKVYVGTVKPGTCGTCGATGDEELRIVYAKPAEDGWFGIWLSTAEPS